MESNKKNRYIRQTEIVTRQNVPIAIVGVGAVGRQVALQLAAMGMSPLTLVDFDTVDDVNLAAQGFREKDIGHAKVGAVAKLCKEINSEIKIKGICDAYGPELFGAEVIFSCTDSIDVRGVIFNEEFLKDTCKLLIDSRMTAEVSRIIRVDMTSQESRDKYNATLFAAKEAYQERCTSKSTIYCANITAGLMVAELSRWIRGFYVLDDCELNILAGSYTVQRPQ